MRGFLALLAALAIVVAGVLVLARDLTQPWLKQRVVALVADQAGYEIDYEDAGLRGLTFAIDGLVVRAYEPLRALAPALLRAEHVSAELSLKAPQLRNLVISRPVVTLLFDERGRTSFDTPPSAGPAKPATPLSKQAEILAQRLPLQHVRVEQLEVTFLRSEAGRIVERDTLSDLSLALDAEPVAEGTRLALRTSGRPVAFARGPAKARGTLALEARATAQQVLLSLRVKVASQDLVPQLEVAELARIEARATFAQGATAITLASLRVGDEAATAQASLTLPDVGAPRVHHAQGDVDALHLLELAAPWLPAWKLRSGKLHYRVDDLSWPATQATIAVEGELDGLALEDLALGRAKLDLKARPSRDGLHAEGHASLDQLTQRDLQVADVTLRFTGTQDVKGLIDGDATVRFASLTQVVTARDGELELHVRKLLDATHGDLRAEATLASIEAPELTATNVRLRAHAPLQEVHAVDGTVSVESVRTAKQALPLELDFALSGNDVERVKAELEARSAGSVLQLQATRRGEALDYELTASLPDFALVRPWLETSDAEMATTLHSKGRVERFSTQPRIRQRSELRLQKAVVGDFHARALELQLDGAGDRLRHQLHADLNVHDLQYAGEHRPHDRLQVELKLDRVKPKVELVVKSDKQAALNAKVAIADRVLDYDVEGKIADLSAFAGLLAQSNALAGFDVNDLEIEVNSKGRITGVIQRADARGIELTADPLTTVGGQGTLAIQSKNFRWAQGDVAVSVPTASWHATLHGADGRRVIDSELRATAVEGALGSERVSMSDVHDHTAVTLTGGIRDGVVEHIQQVTIRNLQQQIAGGYSVGDVEGSLHARRDADGLIKIHELRVDNRAGGTRLSLSGGIQLTRDEQRLSVRSLLEQDLSRMPSLFEGQGKLAMDVTLSSSDFRLFHSAAKLKLEGATVRVPKAKVALESMDGDLPVVTDFLVDRDGVELLRGARINPYAAQRFSDQHPALGYRSFMSIARVQTPYFSFAPFAANLEVARNIVSLSQVELGARNGTITGSGMFEYNGLDSKIDANLRASGVESSHGEPFDGNAALTIGVRERSVEGRADILRIGRRHLTDLLDLQDPLHADDALNQIRRALRFGYPDRVKLSFQHGFANAGVEFGGLARLIKLNDIRGIPLGPLMERMMSTLQPVEATP